MQLLSGSAGISTLEVWLWNLTVLPPVLHDICFLGQDRRVIVPPWPILHLTGLNGGRRGAPLSEPTGLNPVHRTLESPDSHSVALPAFLPS